MVSDVQHGTVSGYTGGCHCAPCTGAWATYNRDRRHAAGGQSRADQEVAYTARELERLGGEDADVKLPVPLTPLGAQILLHVQRRTGKRRGEVIDRLLREYGAEIASTA